MGRVAQWVLAAGLVAAIAFGVRWWSADEPSASPAPPERGAASAPEPESPPVRAGEPDRPAEPEAPSADSAAELRLVGIFPDSALFETNRGASGTVRVGELLPGGAWRLLELRESSAVLENDAGRQIELAVRGGSAPREQSLFGMRADELDRLFDDEPERRLMVGLDQAVDALQATLQLEPDGAGAVRIRNLDPSNPLARLGLRPGDRVLQVDGIDIGSAPQGMVALATTLYSEGGNTILTVERFDGSRVQIATGGGLALPRPEAESESSARSPF